MVEAERGVNDLVASLRDTIGRSVQERPYPALALAVMAGYLAGGGLFSPWTRPLARAALGALLVPTVRERLRGLAGEFRSIQASGAA